MVRRQNQNGRLIVDRFLVETTQSTGVSERTVSRLLPRPRRPPSLTWRTVLTNHVATRASIDFFTVPTVTGRVLCVLVVRMHHRRRIIHVNITEHPTAAWTAQQIIEAFRTTPRPDGC